MAKPSTLWPMEAQPDKVGGRTKTSKRGPPPEPGHPDTLKPDPVRLEKQRESRENGRSEDAVGPEDVEDKKHMLESSRSPAESDATEPAKSPAAEDVEDSNEANASGSQSPTEPDMDEIDLWEPKPPKVLMDDPNTQPLELLSQIQLYATNELVLLVLCIPASLTLCFVQTAYAPSLLANSAGVTWRAVPTLHYRWRGRILAG